MYIVCMHVYDINNIMVSLMLFYCINSCIHCIIDCLAVSSSQRHAAGIEQSTMKVFVCWKLKDSTITDFATPGFLPSLATWLIPAMTPLKGQLTWQSDTQAYRSGSKLQLILWIDWVNLSYSYDPDPPLPRTLTATAVACLAIPYVWPIIVAIDTKCLKTLWRLK